MQWWGVFWDEEVMQSLIDEYEQQNAGVTITYANRWPGGTTSVGSKLYQDELDRVLKANDPVAIPDIFMVHNTWVGNYERYTAPAPASVIDANTLKTAFYPAVAEDFARGDVVRGIPLWMDVLAIIYNKAMLADLAVSKPPADWAEFRTLATNLTERSGSTITQAGFAAGTPDNVSFGVELLYLLMVQNGVPMTDATGNPTFSTDADAEAAVDFYQSFASNSGSWNATMRNDAAAFLEGDLAMLTAPAWRYHDLLAFNEQFDLGINMGVSAMPQLQGQTQPTINWADYWGNMVALNRPNSEAAWKFLVWISQPEQLRKLHQNELIDREYFGSLYPRVDMQQDLQSDQYIRVYNSALSTAKTWYQVDGLAVKELFKALIKTGGSLDEIADVENQVQTIVTNKGKL